MNQKKRSQSQIIGEQGVAILKNLFPPHWVVREMDPDYGIDLDVELFEPDKTGWHSLGEHVFIQVKATRRLKKSWITILESAKLLYPDPVPKMKRKIEVVSFSLETALLSTVERMGHTPVVLLALVDTVAQKVYLICLNDYIHKVLIPVKPAYAKQKTVRIHIPVRNCIPGGQGTDMILWYGKRAKLVSLYSSLLSMEHNTRFYKDESIKAKISTLISLIQRMDILASSEYFHILDEISPKIDSINTLDEQQCQFLWNDLRDSAYLFETISREWFLPSLLGVKTS